MVTVRLLQFRCDVVLRHKRFIYGTNAKGAAAAVLAGIQTQPSVLVVLVHRPHRLAVVEHVY